MTACQACVVLFDSKTIWTLASPLQYIYISKEEMQAVAEYIKRRGRIAIGELAAKSNTFIDLEAKATTVSALSALLVFGVVQHASVLL